MFLLKFFKRSNTNNEKDHDSRKLQSQSCSPRTYMIKDEPNKKEREDRDENEKVEQEETLNNTFDKKQIKNDIIEKRSLFLEGFDLSPVSEKKKILTPGKKQASATSVIANIGGFEATKSKSVENNPAKLLNPPIIAETLQQDQQGKEKTNISFDKKAEKKKKKDKSTQRPRVQSGLPPHQKKKRKSSKKRKKTKDQKDKSRIIDNSLQQPALNTSERDGLEVFVETEVVNIKKEIRYESVLDGAMLQLDSAAAEPVSFHGKESQNPNNISIQGNPLAVVMKSEPINGPVRGRSKKKLEPKKNKITTVRSHSFSKEVTVIPQGVKNKAEEEPGSKIGKKNLAEVKKPSERPLPKINSAKARQERIGGYINRPQYINNNNISLNDDIITEGAINMSNNKVNRSEQEQNFTMDHKPGGNNNDDIFERIDKILRRSSAYPERLRNNYEKSLLKLYNLEASNLMRKDKILDKLANIEQNFDKKRGNKKKLEDNWELEEFDETGDNKNEISLSHVGGMEKNNYISNNEDSARMNKDSSNPASLTVINEENLGESGNWEKVTLNANYNIKQGKTSFNREVKKIEDLQTRNFNALTNYLNIKENLLDLNLKKARGQPMNK